MRGTLFGGGNRGREGDAHSTTWTLVIRVHHHNQSFSPKTNNATEQYLARFFSYHGQDRVGIRASTTTSALSSAASATTYSQGTKF